MDGRVLTRAKALGHNVAIEKLIKRFPKTQEAIKHAVSEADLAILVDNSRSEKEAFTVCRIQMRQNVIFDLRQTKPIKPISRGIKIWLDRICPIKRKIVTKIHKFTPP